MQAQLGPRQASTGTRPLGNTPENQQPPAPVAVSVVTQGDVSEDERSYAVDRIRLLLEKVKEPVLLARLKLTLNRDPARERPAIAQALLDINGDPVRAHIAAETPQVAADLLYQRLRAKLEHRARHRIATRTRRGIPEPGEWRHGDLPTIRPAYYQRPIADRQLVRRKTFAIDELTPEEAAFDMEQLDYEFYLFRDLGSGQDTVVEREEDGSYRLSCPDPGKIDLGAASGSFEVSQNPAQALTVEEALKHLDDTGSRFLFFIDSTDHRGTIVYHRYDGHYGLITSG